MEEQTHIQALTEAKDQLEPHELRMLNEYLELDDKLSKLTKFVGSEMFNGLDRTDRDLLHKQQAFMQGYANTLHRRLARVRPLL